jgi:hypothetical protein
MLRSRVLGAELLHLLVDLVDTQRPVMVGSVEAVGPFAHKLDEHCPSLLLVTPEQERQFAAGKFDDALNAKAVERACKLFKDLGVHLPSFSQYLVNEFQDGKLSGARLELVRRILTIHAVEIKGKAK